MRFKVYLQINLRDICPVSVFRLEVEGFKGSSGEAVGFGQISSSTFLAN